MVNRVGAILGVMGGHDGTNGLRQASALRVTTAFYGCVSWLHWDDIILCYRGMFLANYPPHITLFLNLAKIEIQAPSTTKLVSSESVFW